jgi:HTH-type transcriptional regulator/antitoxin HigA
LIEHYEAANYPIPPPDPIEAIKFRMEQMEMTQADLAKILRSKSRASEVLSGKRKLTINMMRKIQHELGIPAEVLLA